MKFLSNTYNPNDEDKAKMYLVLNFRESREDEWQRWLDWLKGKVIGRPQASDTYTVEQLEAMGLVGVYDSSLSEENCNEQ